MCSQIDHAVSLHFMYYYYNFARIHQAPRVTPAMEAGVTDHIWSVEEMAGLLDGYSGPKDNNAAPIDKGHELDHIKFSVMGICPPLDQLSGLWRGYFFVWRKRGD
jgi:hypothetical protein